MQLGMVFLDGSNIHAHQKAAGAAKKGDLEPDAMRVRLLADRVAAMAPRVCAIANGRGRAVAFSLAPGQAHELPMAHALISRLPETPLWVIADRG